MPGRPSKALSPDQIARLRAYQRAKRYSLAQLNRAMASSFRWQTLARAIRREPIWEFNHEEITAWLDKFVPASALPRDYKMDSAGDRGEPNGAPAVPPRLRSEKRGAE